MPTPNDKRKPSPFTASWQNTLDLLERELNQLRAKEITIEGFFSWSNIRNDGWPKNNARPTQPGIVLAFETKQGQMIFPCDLYNKWEANLRAIALTLGDLRSIKRHGVVTEREEQYTGWLRLPAASPTDELISLAEGLIIYTSVDCTADQVLSNRSIFDSVWKEAVKQSHSDNPENPRSGDELR